MEIIPITYHSSIKILRTAFEENRHFLFGNPFEELFFLKIKYSVSHSSKL
jgi:hypothetical protein